MTIITRYTNSYNTISKMICDGTAFVWIAYNKDSSGICHLQKVSAHDLDQVYFDISVTANEIIDMIIANSYIHLIFDNSTSTYVGRAYHITAPMSNNFNYIRQSDMTEDPVGISYSSTDTRVNILTPGSSSATNAKVYRYNASTGAYVQTLAVRVDNIRIVDATSITRDSSDNQWIVTNTNPAKLIRMWFESGAVWKFAFHNIE